MLNLFFIIANCFILNFENSEFETNGLRGGQCAKRDKTPINRRMKLRKANQKN